MAELTHGPIEGERLTREARRADCGALTVFYGTTRDHHEGRRVTLLHYEAYDAMALAALENIERAALARHEVASCRIVHRLGEVPIGEASVMVVVAAVHRAPAFEACRWAMDELKRRVPIWKRETFEGGAKEWVKGTPLG
ncbi:MAG: molybdenum cofactor biosynthesis protein MoaE [Candidatus Eiseniibacteriota bacterium]